MTELLRPQRGPLLFAPMSAASRPFWEACQRDELSYQSCDSCGKANFPPTENCRDCLSGELTWLPSEGKGELYSWTIIMRPVTPDYRTPYAPAIVDVSEGFQMLSSLVDLSPGSLYPGMALGVRFFQDIGGRSLPYFGPR